MSKGPGGARQPQTATATPTTMGSSQASGQMSTQTPGAAPAQTYWTATGGNGTSPSEQFIQSHPMFQGFGSNWHPGQGIAPPGSLSPLENFRKMLMPNTVPSPPGPNAGGGMGGGLFGRLSQMPEFQQFLSHNPQLSSIWSRLTQQQGGAQA